MKLKFRADADDLLIFVIFAIFLLYVVALAVVNLNSFATQGHFAGLNPMPAFAPDLFFSTVVFYIVILLGLFASAGSMFFEREKGFGITTEKKDKGYSRWAKEKEIQEELTRVEITQKNSKAAGVPIMLSETEMWVDNGEYHSLVIGATGSGKTQTVILPMVHSLAKARESMIITDPKGEIYEKTSNMLRARGYQILLLNFRDPQNGNAWNPMSLPYQMYKSGNQDKAIELLDDLALNILYDDSNKNADPFWEKTSADYFSGVALGLFEDAKPNEININSISLATTVGEEKFGGSTYIKEYFAGKDPGCAAAINASSTIMAPSETKGSILSVFKQKVKLFASRENLSEMLSYSDINLETIGERPTAVFIVIQDEKKTYHSLVTILLKQCYETLISVAQKHGGKLPVRTNFLLDEFANMPPLKDITTMITAARSRLIRFTMIIQNFAQLDQVYGKENAETIKGNCGNIIYLITTELKALEEISKMCGEVKSKKDDKTASTPLVTISDLQKMKQFEVIIMRIRMNPFKTKFIPYFKWNIKRYEVAEYPHREKQEVHVFDLREFVKEAKKKKLMEMMNSGEGGSPFPGGMPNMPASPFPGGLPGMGGMPNMGGMNPFGDMPNNGDKRNNTTPRTPFETFPGNMSNNAKGNSEFNIDDLVKKIDAKIAEIEAEEKRQKELEEKQKDSDIKEETPTKDIKVTDANIEENRSNNQISDEIKSTDIKNQINVSEPVEKPKKTVDDFLDSMNKLKEEKEINKSLEDTKELTKQIVEDKPKDIIIHQDKIPKKEIDITDDAFFDDFFDDED